MSRSRSIYVVFNPLSANPTKWSSTLKQFVDNLPTNCLSVFDHFVKLALKGLSDVFRFFNLNFIVINHITSLKQTHLFFVHFLDYLPLFLDDNMNKESK